MPGFAGFIESFRPGPEDRPDPLTRARWAPDKPEDPPDEDERQANLMAAGYSPGSLTDLARRHADVMSELATVRDANEKARKAQERIARDHTAGRITAFDIMRMDFGEPDVARERQLERRAGNLRRQLEEAQAMISPPQQRGGDPLEAASRRAHEVFREVTRARWAEAQGARPPSERRPFGGAGGLAVRSEPVTCPDCIAVGATPEQSALIHLDPTPQQCASPAGGPCTCFEPAGQDGRQREKLTERARIAREAEVDRLLGLGFSLETAQLAATPYGARMAVR